MVLNLKPAEELRAGDRVAIVGFGFDFRSPAIVTSVRGTTITSALEQQHIDGFEPVVAPEEDICEDCAIKQAHKAGWDEGWDAGVAYGRAYADGHREGWEEGYEAGLADADDEEKVS
jgi:hypothetical protein